MERRSFPAGRACRVCASNIRGRSGQVCGLASRMRHETGARPGFSENEQNGAMQIAEFEVIRLQAPELSRAAPTSLGAGLRLEEPTGNARETDHRRRASSAGACPATRTRRLLENWIKPRLLGQDPFALEQHARTFRNAGGALGRRDRAVGHHRQGVRPAALQAVGRLPRPRARLRQLRRAALRASSGPRTRPPAAPRAGGR